MPKMPEGEKKEESAESLAEKKEQVIMFHLNCLCSVLFHYNESKITSSTYKCRV